MTIHHTAFALPLALNHKSIPRLNLQSKRARCSVCASVSDRPTPSKKNNTSISRRDMGKFLLHTCVSTAIVVSSTSVGNKIDANAASNSQKAPVFTKDESGILYLDVKPGSGIGPVDGDFVIIDYLAFLSDGKIFDNRKGFVFQMGQRQVIPGLEAAVASMKPGGERRIVVPPSLAYGEKGVCLPEKEECLVPPGERLGYDVTLQRVAIPPT